jgi:hypothetical protein
MGLMSSRGLGLTVAVSVCVLVGMLVSGAQAFAASAPVIEEVSFSNVTYDSATISARVDTGELETTYSVQYGTTSAYGSETNASRLAAGSNGAITQLTGLQPDSTYHFRVVVSNEDGNLTDATDTEFMTLPPTVQGLPDGRVYEMVTPVENQDRETEVPLADSRLSGEGHNGIYSPGPFEPAASGDAITYSAEQTTPGGTGLGGQGEGNQYIAMRAPAGGWRQSIIQPTGNKSAYYQGFTSELSIGFLASMSSEGGRSPSPTLAPGAPSEVSVLYSRTLTEESYTPFFTIDPPDRGGSFQAYGVPAPRGREGGIPVYAGSSANGIQDFFEGNDALTPGAEAGNGAANNLYETVGSQLRLVNVLPNGSSHVGATFGGPPLTSEEMPDFSHVISENGTRVFWTDLNTGDIYVREDGTSTVQVSAGPAQYWTATPEGSLVFYTEGEELWRFDVETDTRTRLEGAAAGVQGVVGVSNDGEFVYFVADGALSSGATEGRPNLYLLRGETPIFIATLAGEDGYKIHPYRENGGTKAGDWQRGLGERTAEVTPDGKAVVFMSSNSLTGYDNEVAGSETLAQEVYVYEAEGNTLFCASCSRSGEQPQPNESLNKGGAAGFLPISWNNTYIQQWISEDGSQVFFDSDEPLVSQDTNGTQDVYEWERNGAGSCDENDGCIYLLSGGFAPTMSWLIGSSMSGGDVFFASRAQLTAEDGNEDYEIYDARVGGVIPPAPFECSGTGCQGLPSAPPVFATPSSVTFNGVGNFAVSTVGAPKSKSKPKTLTRAQLLSKALRACRAKHEKKKRASCEVKARARYRDRSRVSKASKGRN